MIDTIDLTLHFYTSLNDPDLHSDHRVMRNLELNNTNDFISIALFHVRHAHLS